MLEYKPVIGVDVCTFAWQHYAFVHGFDRFTAHGRFGTFLLIRSRTHVVRVV